MIARSHADLHQIRRGVERIRRISDRIVGVGPFGVGLDALLSWVPGVGAIYSGMAGLMLLAEAVRARASPWTLVRMAVLLGVDTLLDIPGGNPLSAAADTLFAGHRWSADLLLRHMDETLYVEGAPGGAGASRERLAREGKRRIVHLG